MSDGLNTIPSYWEL